MTIDLGEQALLFDQSNFIVLNSAILLQFPDMILISFLFWEDGVRGSGFQLLQRSASPLAALEELS